MASSNPTEPLSEQEPLSRPWFPHGIPKPKAVKPDAKGFMKCDGCPEKVHIDNKGQYRPGIWCSRECAYDLS